MSDTPPAPDQRPLPFPEPRSFRYEERDQVGIITLDRPDRFNALTFEVYRELTDFFKVVERRARSQGGARALLLQGEGKAFCSGGDVDDIITRLFDRDQEGILTFTRMTGELIQSMRLCALPIVASVKRVAAGAGAVMALASDLRVMGERSFFAFLFPQVGLSGADMGSAYLLPRVIGAGPASELLLTGDRVKAPRCLELGLATRVVADDPPSAVDDAAFELAQKLAQGPAFALRMTKTMIQKELDMNLDQAIEAEAQAQAICMQTEDFKRAYNAFVARKKPIFEGD